MFQLYPKKKNLESILQQLMSDVLVEAGVLGPGPGDYQRGHAAAGPGVEQVLVILI
jgi:hypothetical protein